MISDRNFDFIKLLSDYLVEKNSVRYDDSLYGAMANEIYFGRIEFLNYLNINILVENYYEVLILIIRKIKTHDMANIIKILITKIDPIFNNHCLKCLCKKYRHDLKEIFKLFLYHEKNKNICHDDLSECFEIALKYNKKEVLKMLLDHPKINMTKCLEYIREDVITRY